MKEPNEWNQRMFPWLYPYGNRMNYLSLWDQPERMEDEEDFRRLQEMYPIMARRLKPYVDEVCSLLEYPGSMMYDEQPDKIQFRNIAGKIYDKMKEKYPVQENNDQDENLEMLPENEREKRYPPGENWLGDMVQVVLLQEMCRRREERRKQRRWY